MCALIESSVLERLLPDLLLFFKLGACLKRDDFDGEATYHKRCADELSELVKAFAGAP